MRRHTVYEPADLIFYAEGKGILLKEKSVIAFQKSDGKIAAFGTQAWQLAEQDRGDLTVVSPLRRGAVEDFTVAAKLFSLLLAKALGKKPVWKRAMAVCVPQGITQVEKKALEEALIYAGASEVLIADLPLEQFLQELPEKTEKKYQKIKIVIGITKEEPERYVEEALQEIVAYARQEQISPERVGELLSAIAK